jgi:hypothetical protein
VLCGENLRSSKRFNITPTVGMDVLKDVLAIFCDLLEEWVDVTVRAHS